LVTTANARPSTQRTKLPPPAFLREAHIVHFGSPTSDRIAELVRSELDGRGVRTNVLTFDRSDGQSLTGGPFVLVFPIRGDDRIPDVVEQWLFQALPSASTHSLCITGDFVSGESFDPLVADEATRILRDRGSLPRLPPLLIDTPTSDEHLGEVIRGWIPSMLEMDVPLPIERGDSDPDLDAGAGVDRIREPSLRAICRLLPGPPQFRLDDEGRCVRLSLDDGRPYVRSLLVGLTPRRVHRILGLVGDLGRMRHFGLPFARVRMAGVVPPSVRSLDLRGNQIGDASFLEHAPGVEALNMADCDLQEVPTGLQGLPSLQTLIIAKNRLRRVPDWFSGLRTLRRLTVYRNQLSSLGSALSGFPQLRLLNLGANVLGFSGDELQDLPRLEAVGLRLLGLHEVPGAVLRLPSLRHVDVSKNPITIPSGAGVAGITFAQRMPAWRWDDAG
jgi:Leucine-rich repeat (LRR) protein